MSEIHILPAAEKDVGGIAALVNGFAAQNLMLPRTEDSILQSLPDWLVATVRTEPEQQAAPSEVPAPRRAAGDRMMDSSRLLGCGSLVALTDQLVEIRSLAVAPAGQGRGIGRRIVQDLVQMATARGYAQICALTLQEAFFEKIGFEVVDRWSISPKLWQECIYCPKFHRCDEVAVARNLNDSPLNEGHAGHAAASSLLKWQAWQPLKLAYRRAGALGAREAAAHSTTNRNLIQLDGGSSRKESEQ